MKLTVIGCGDAFSSGGRYQSCYLLDTKDGRILLECGANSPLAMKRAKIDVSMIDAVIITHCHGDHFGGLPFLYLNKLFLDNRDHVVDIFGPVGFKERLRDLMECFYAGILATPRRFSFRFHEIIPGSSSQWKCINILGFEVYHYSGTPALALRIEDGERCFAFSGDSGWCEGVIQAGKDADLYLMECTMFSTKTDVHIDYKTLQTKWDDISAKRCMLTHMSEEMLTAKNKIDTSRYILASDGFVIEV